MKRLLCVLLLVPALAGAQTPRERIAKVAADYGIEVQIVDRPLSLRRTGYTVTANPVTDEVLAKYEPIFEEEWRRYPRTLMVRTKLGRVVIGADVRVEKQPRAVVPEFVPGWFWLDAEVGSRLPAYGRHALHHDFFHMIDYWDSPDHLRDAGWERLNLPNTKYGQGGWFMQKGNVGALRTDLPGFLTAYSTSGVEEDKAEVYSHLLTSPTFVAERVRLDPVIAAKVAQLKALVAAFEPAMDEDWFKRNGAEPKFG